MTFNLSNPAFSVISDVAEQMNIPAFIIGGYVRDLIMERPSVDVDIVVEASGIDFARKVAGTAWG